MWWGARRVRTSFAVGLVAVGAAAGCTGDVAPAVDPVGSTPAAQEAVAALIRRDLGHRGVCAYLPDLPLMSQTPTTPPKPDRFDCLLQAASRNEPVGIVMRGAAADGGAGLAIYTVVDPMTVVYRRYAITPDGATSESTMRTCMIDRAKRYGEPFSDCTTPGPG